MNFDWPGHKPPSEVGSVSYCTADARSDPVPGTGHDLQETPGAVISPTLGSACGLRGDDRGGIVVGLELLAMDSWNNW